MAHKTHAQLSKAATRVLPEEDPEFQIAPMIDILLVLLVFFMSIATEQVLQVNKEVVLPVAKEAKEDTNKNKKSELMLNLTWNEISGTGAIIVDQNHIEPSVLQDLIKRKKEINPELRVIIRADKNAKYQYVRSIMVAMGQAGVPTVTFSAVDKEMEPKK